MPEFRTAMAATDELPPLSEAQIEIMNVVWDRGEAGVADVWAEISARRPVARNTVLTLMTRLEEKGWLVRDGGGTAHRWSAAVPRKRTVGNMVRRLVDAAFGGSAEGLVHALLAGRSVDADEAARLRALIDEAEKRDRSKRGG